MNDYAAVTIHREKDDGTYEVLAMERIPTAKQTNKVYVIRDFGGTSEEARKLAYEKARELSNPETIQVQAKSGECVLPIEAAASFDRGTLVGQIKLESHSVPATHKFSEGFLEDLADALMPYLNKRISDAFDSKK